MEEKIIEFIKGYRTEDREGNDVVYVDDEELLIFAKMLKEAITVTRCCTELPNKAVKDSQLSDMVAVYKMMCRPDANFEKYYSKGFTECWEWLKRITK